MYESVRAVDRALDILLCFSREEPVLSLTRIARQLGMPKSTAHRLLSTLESKRFVTRDEATSTYHLGYRLIEMGALVLQKVNLEQWLLPYLRRLSDACGETVDFAVLDGPHVVYLLVVESTQRVKLAAAVGQRLPAHCTASGKAFMAFLPDDRVRAILDAGLTPFTERTRVAPEDLHGDLRAARERGFAMSEEEYEPDIHAVAAPILDAGGRPVAAIAIVGPSYRLSRERMLDLGRMALETTGAIGREIGAAALAAIITHNATTGTAGSTDRRG